MENRVEELRRYIELLVILSKEGFNCKREIKQALEALHKEMGFKSPNNGIADEIAKGITVSTGGIKHWTNTGGKVTFDNPNDLKG